MLYGISLRVVDQIGWDPINIKGNNIEERVFYAGVQFLRNFAYSTWNAKELSINARECVHQCSGESVFTSCRPFKGTLYGIRRIWLYSGGFRGEPRGPGPFSSEIYHQMLVKLKIWYTNLVIFFLFRGVGPPLWNFWILHRCMCC
jgi:hypothetical protein